MRGRRSRSTEARSEDGQKEGDDNALCNTYVNEANLSKHLQLGNALVNLHSPSNPEDSLYNVVGGIAVIDQRHDAPKGAINVPSQAV